MSVSAPDLRCAECPAALIEIVALKRGGAGSACARNIAGGLPELARARWSDSGLIVGARPDRWLALAPLNAAESCAAGYRSAIGDRGAVIDVSSGYRPLFLSGERVREALARGCRLDLRDDVFLPGHVAATLIAQVALIMAALPGGILLLPPASLAQHLREWLTGIAPPCNFSSSPPREPGKWLWESHR